MKTEQEFTGNASSGRNVSYWIDPVTHPALSPLHENLVTDVVVIGGGLAGLSVAYCLLKAGKQVVLVEDGMIGSGETGRTTAHLVTALDDRYYELAKTFSAEEVQLIAQSHQKAIDFVESTVREEHIGCGFERVDGFLFLHPSDAFDSLQKEFEAAKAAGVNVSLVEQVPGMTGSRPAICFHNQAQFHPLRYLQGLAQAIERMGGKVFTGTHAEEIDHEGIKTKDRHTVKASHVVVATNSPVNNLYATFTKHYPYRTYVIGALVHKGSLPAALWWDTGDFTINKRIPPYHYVRTQEHDDMYDLLISGGEDHPVGNTKNGVPEEKRYAALETWTKQHFPVQKVVYKWSGQVLEPIDGIALIGRNPHDKDNVYIVTADSGNGMTHCSFAGLLLTDLILGRDNPWEKIYDPARFKVSKVGAIAGQVMTEIRSYLEQMPNFSDTEELKDIRRGEGRLVDMLEEKFGVYRDNNDKLHIVTAQCTHLKCTVHWNADELSWDCPCHGSRFTYEGKVINGPANFDLPRYDTEGQPVEETK